MTRRACTFLLMLGLTTVLACRTLPELQPESKTLVAVIEEVGNLAVLQGSDDDWHRVGVLPKHARAIRLSPNGAFVAWIQDEVDRTPPVMSGFVMEVGRSTTLPLGTLGLRQRESMGLDVNSSGAVLLLREDGMLEERGGRGILGRGEQPIYAGDGTFTYVTRERCLFAMNPPICGAALRPLEWNDATLLARTNSGLIEQRGSQARTLPLVDVIDARRSPRTGEVLVTHRVNEDGRTREALSLWKRDGSVVELMRTGIVISAEWDDGAVLVVRKETPEDIYEMLLAHAPEEFGGDALSGETVRLDPGTNEESPIAGLSGKQVRKLQRVRLREGP